MIHGKKIGVDRSSTAIEEGDTVRDNYLEASLGMEPLDPVRNVGVVQHEMLRPYWMRRKVLPLFPNYSVVEIIIC